MLLKQITVLLVLVASISILVSTVAMPVAAAQSDQTTAEPTGTAPSENTTYELVVPGDSNTRIVSFEYENGQMELVVEADRPTPITLTAAPESTGRSSTGSGYVQSQVISDGRTSLSIRSPNGVVWVSTQESVKNGKFGYVRASTSSFPIPGPWDSTDARNAGIGGALGTALVSILIAWKQTLTSTEDGEQVA